MKIEQEIKGNALVVRLAGEFDLHSAEEFRAVVDESLDREGVVNLVLNLKEISFIDSSGLGAILGRYRKISGGPGTMIIAGPSRRVRQLLELSGIPRIIPIYVSEKVALDRLSEGGRSS